MSSNSSGRKTYFISEHCKRRINLIKRSKENGREKKENELKQQMLAGPIQQGRQMVEERMVERESERKRERESKSTSRVGGSKRQIFGALSIPSVVQTGTRTLFP